jgi:hypothetical protein
VLDAEKPRAGNPIARFAQPAVVALLASGLPPTVRVDIAVLEVGQRSSSLFWELRWDECPNVVLVDLVRGQQETTEQLAICAICFEVGPHIGAALRSEVMANNHGLSLPIRAVAWSEIHSRGGMGSKR